MEEKGILDIDNPNHLFILHQVYLPRIQSGFDEFKRGWNHHKVTTERNKTPLQLMSLNRRPVQEDAAETMVTSSLIPLNVTIRRAYSILCIGKHRTCIRKHSCPR